MSQSGDSFSSSFIQVTDTLLVKGITPEPGTDIVQHPFLSDFLQLDGTAFGYVRESFFYFPVDGYVFPSHQGLEPAGEIIFPIGLGYKIQYCETVFSFIQTQSPAQLLEEYGYAVGGTQEQNGIDAGNIHSLIEQVHHENESQVSTGQFLAGTLPFLFGRMSIQRQRPDSLLVEIICHKMGMVLRNTEPYPVDFPPVRRIALYRIQNGSGPLVGRAGFHYVEIGQGPYIVMTIGPFYMA